MKQTSFFLIGIALLVSCQSNSNKVEERTADSANSNFPVIRFAGSGDQEFTCPVPETGRYRVTAFSSKGSGEVWLEDYVTNQDGRTYNVTGTLVMKEGKGQTSIDGAPLAAGDHPMKVHVDGNVQLDSLKLELMIPFSPTPDTLTQSMEGEDWELVWSDEFDGEGLPDTNRWSYNVGNWGWGNDELQYYTYARTENARQANGALTIEAIKNDQGRAWTSARLTTQGKVAFQYGRIEFRAKVPEGRGTWAAGWLLGDAYRDEISWPYCGEIDVLECVGYEIDNETGKGKNHATCHTRAYYFKQNNQISSILDMDSMNTRFHTFAVEWYPDRILGFVDGEHYYTYDQTANEREWPFDQPQNIIINLAVGGGWGGMKGVDESYDRHQYVLDYIRVYAKK